MNEQERANRLSEAIDRLMDGKRPLSNDPLIKVAQKLARMQLLPRRMARQRFDRQYMEWFGVDPSRLHKTAVKQRSLALWTLLATAAASLLFLLVVPRLSVRSPMVGASSVPQMTPSPEASVSPVIIIVTTRLIPAASTEAVPVRATATPLACPTVTARGTASQSIHQDQQGDFQGSNTDESPQSNLTVTAQPTLAGIIQVTTPCGASGASSSN